MAASHPYISSGGPIVQAITQFRKSFPNVVDASTLKKLGLASNNESYLINILKFLNLIDDEGKKTQLASKAFVLHKDEDFQNSFSDVVKSAYAELFELQQDDAWKLDDESLITYFRQTDQSTEIVGKRQAVTFKSLAGLAGKREISAPRSSSGAKAAAKDSGNPAKKKTKKPKVSNLPDHSGEIPPINQNRDNTLGLTVRIEINLPADGSQATYDRIFKSIKENLIDAYKA